MRRNTLVAATSCALVLATGSLALAESDAPVEATPEVAEKPAPTYTPEQLAAGAKAFGDVHAVLTSPRCANCHPVGDAPLQTDAMTPHKMNVTRASEANGMPCSTCHREQNAEATGAPAGAPPGAPNWHLPPAETPMVFQGRTAPALCAQLKDPAQNGGKTLAQLLHHVGHDPLVLWGWNPGEGRTKPPLAHDVFVASFRTWVDAGGPCPQ